MADKKFTPLSNTEIAAFCSQIAIILKSGISSIEGISIMLEDSQNADEKELLQAINDTLMQTGSLTQALEDSHAYPDYMISMVRIGEQTGRLDDVMDSLAVYYEKEASLAESIKSAVTYPLIMIVMMLLVILILIMKVMPIFNQVFTQLGSSMSGLPLVILDIGQFLNHHVPVLLVILAALAGLVFYICFSGKRYQILQSLSAKFTNSRQLYEKISARRFASGMALTLSSGLPPEECLNLTCDLIEDPEFQKRLKTCQEELSSGGDFSEVLLNNHIFTGLYARLVSIGGRTGSMEEIMQKIADQYDEDIDVRLAGIISSIEPTLVIILSVIVGIILLSVMLPLVSIMAGL